MEKKYQCRQCNQMLSHNMYYRDDRTATGLKGICKHCCHKKYLSCKEKKIKYQMNYIYENYDKYLKYQREYRRKKLYNSTVVALYE